MDKVIATVVATLLFAGSVSAFEKLDGYFIAFEVCDAYQSKNRLTNPGDIRTTPFHAYAIIAINKAGGDFYQVRIPDAPVTTERWVNTSCGLHVIDAGTVTLQVLQSLSLLHRQKATNPRKTFLR